MVMSSQGLALSPVLGNKRKKKAVLRQKKIGWKETQSTKKDRYNAKLVLLIEKGKENKVYQSISENDEDEQFDLAIKKQSNKQSVLNTSDNIVKGFITPRSV